MRINIKNRQKDLKIPKSFKKALAAFLEHKKVLSAEVFVHYVSKKEICRIHTDFFGDPSPTDTISLPIDSPKDTSPFSILGEVFICPKVALEYAAHHDVDPYEETLLYTLHGLLHLLGYDDQTPQQRKLMRRQEREAMTLLRPLIPAIFG